MNTGSYFGRQVWHDVQAHHELVRRVSLAPNREWIESYFGLGRAR